MDLPKGKEAVSKKHQFPKSLDQSTQYITLPPNDTGKQFKRLVTILLICLSD